MMSKKKAFVRYADNKAVPGSLIVRTQAPSVGTWKEVVYDLCCGDASCCDKVTLTFELPVLFPPPYTAIEVKQVCDSPSSAIIHTSYSNLANTIEEVILDYNNAMKGFSSLSLNGNLLSVTLCKMTCSGERSCPTSSACLINLYSENEPYQQNLAFQCVN